MLPQRPRIRQHRTPPCHTAKPRRDKIACGGSGTPDAVPPWRAQGARGCGPRGHFTNAHPRMDYLDNPASQPRSRRRTGQAPSTPVNRSTRPPRQPGQDRSLRWTTAPHKSKPRLRNPGAKKICKKKSADGKALSSRRLLTNPRLWAMRDEPLHRKPDRHPRNYTATNPQTH